jgi:hypothetical protein
MNKALGRKSNSEGRAPQDPNQHSGIRGTHPSGSR